MTNRANNPFHLQRNLRWQRTSSSRMSLGAGPETPPLHLMAPHASRPRRRESLRGPRRHLVTAAGVLRLLCLLGPGALLPLARAANWAQVVGRQRQNTVTPARAGFSPRWGHTTVHLAAGTAGDDVVESMVVMGGDSVESDPQNREIVSHAIVGVHHDGSRGFRNDVHSAASYRCVWHRERARGLW